MSKFCRGIKAVVPTFEKRERKKLITWKALPAFVTDRVGMMELILI
jgi:hypothetical protein